MGKSVPLVSLALALLLACSREPRLCEVCRRTIHPEVQAVVLLEDGREVRACCPRCALHSVEGGRDRVRRIEVTDHDGDRSLPLGEAFLVEGSDETPCLEHHPVTDDARVPMRICYDRCMPSLIAFRDAAAARAFIAGHGGALLPPGSLPAPAAPGG